MGSDMYIAKITGTDLLTSSDRVHGVNSRDTGLDHLFRVDTRERVDGGPVDVEVVFGPDGRTLVDGLTRTVEDSSLHVLADSELHGVSAEADSGS